MIIGRVVENGKVTGILVSGGVCLILKAANDG